MVKGKQGGKVIEIAGITFDSQEGELTLGDMEELEHKGVDLMKMSEGDALSISKTRIVAQICLHKANTHAGDALSISKPRIVTDEFMSAIPASKISELGDFVSSFFIKSFPGKEKK